MKRVTEVARGVFVNESGTGIVDRVVQPDTPYAKDDVDVVVTVGGVRVPMPPPYVEPAQRQTASEPSVTRMPSPGSAEWAAYSEGVRQQDTAIFDIGGSTEIGPVTGPKPRSTAPAAVALDGVAMATHTLPEAPVS